MINFEKYAVKIKEEAVKGYENFFCIIPKIKNKRVKICTRDDCANCMKESINWLLEEYKEPIQLTKWEYDLILNCLEIYRYPNEDILKNLWTIKGMKRKGYFKGINDLNITFKEIKDNHIIVEDNYEDFDQNCK